MSDSITIEYLGSTPGEVVRLATNAALLALNLAKFTVKVAVGVVVGVVDWFFGNTQFS